jgi:hypothetical protein
MKPDRGPIGVDQEYRTFRISALCQSTERNCIGYNENRWSGGYFSRTSNVVVRCTAHVKDISDASALNGGRRLPTLPFACCVIAADYN